MSTKLTCINLKRTKTLSNIPSNSSSDVPLLPARSFSSRNFAISSAGRFCQHEPNIMFYSVTERKKIKGHFKNVLMKYMARSNKTIQPTTHTVICTMIYLVCLIYNIIHQICWCHQLMLE